MIGFKKKFVFVHIPRTGGTSIEAFLKPYIEFPKQVTNAGDLRHFSMDRYYKIFGDVINDFYKFTVVRNPWDRMVSYYFHLNKEFNEKKFKKILSLSGRFGQVKDCDFADRVTGPLYFHFESCWYWIHKNPRKEKMGVIKFESLNRGFASVCADLRLSQGELPWINKRERNHYSEYYNDETKDIIKKAYADDIKAFGYKYETV